MANPYRLIDRSGVDDDATLPTPDLSKDPVPVWAQPSAVTDGGTPDRRGRPYETTLPQPANGGRPDVQQFRRRAAVVVGCLVLVNVLALGTLFAAATPRFGFPSLVSPGILAYTFGLRHAVDADHIAAIDNVSRSLLESGKCVALGHVVGWLLG